MIFTLQHSFQEQIHHSWLSAIINGVNVDVSQKSDHKFDKIVFQGELLSRFTHWTAVTKVACAVKIASIRPTTFGGSIFMSE